MSLQVLFSDCVTLDVSVKDFDVWHGTDDATSNRHGAEPLLVSCSSNVVHVWDATKLKLVQTLKVRADDLRVFLEETRGTDAGEGGEGYVPCLEELVCNRSGSAQAVVDSDIVVNFCAFSPCGKYVLCGLNVSMVVVLALETGAVHCLLEGHEDEVLSCFFYPKKGELLFTSSADGTVRCWDWCGGRPAEGLPFPFSVHGSSAVSIDGVVREGVDGGYGRRGQRR